MRKHVILGWIVAAAAIVFIGRMVDWDRSDDARLPDPIKRSYVESYGMLPPTDQTFDSAWGGTRSEYSRSQDKHPVLPAIGAIQSISHLSFDSRSDKWNPSISQAQLGRLRQSIGGQVPGPLQRLLAVSDGFFDSPEESDFGFFRPNEDEELWEDPALSVEHHSSSTKQWSLLSSNQIIELKSRLDRYLSQVKVLTDRDVTWFQRVIGLRTELVPIAYAPSRGSLICLEPNTGLLFVLANNQNRNPNFESYFTFQPEASHRVMIHPTYTRLESILKNGPCNSSDIIPSDIAISDSFLETLKQAARAQLNQRHYFSFLAVIGCPLLTFLAVFFCFRHRYRTRPRTASSVPA